MYETGEIDDLSLVGYWFSIISSLKDDLENKIPPRLLNKYQLEVLTIIRKNSYIMNHFVDEHMNLMESFHNNEFYN